MDGQHWLGMNLALGSTLRHLHSARPDAPVVPERRRAAPAVRQLDPVRRATAALLRRAAARVEPTAVRPCRPAA